jgi:hypothetical protein
MQINITYDSSVNSAPAGFIANVQAGVQYLENEFTAPVTINIDVGYGEVDGVPFSQAQAAGESRTTSAVPVSYSALRSALIAENAPGANTLPATSPLSGTLDLTPAQATALGFRTNNGTVDGYVGFSATAPAIYTVEHEITEVMGRTSSIARQPNSYHLMDLFRWSSPGVRDLTAGGSGSTAYFSIDNGVTNLGTWNNDATNGVDLGDWYGSNVPNNGEDAFASTSGRVNPVVSQTDITLMEAIGWITNRAPANTTAVMVMNQASTGAYEIYDMGSNTAVGAAPLTNIGSPWKVAGLGNFSGSDTSDMLLRNTTTGVFEIVDVSNNNASAPIVLGGVGLEVQVAGFGDFSSRPGETDMLMRNMNTGQFEMVDFANNAVPFSAILGGAGLEVQVYGFGDFSGRANETDMLMRDVNTGVVELVDFANNAVSSVTVLGNLGAEWHFAGSGDFSGRPGETDLLARNVNTGDFELYDFQNGQVTSATALGNVGLEIQVVGIADFSGNPNETDMLMRNMNTGTFELVDFANNAVSAVIPLGNVGLEWSVVGTAPFQATASSAPAASVSDAAQLPAPQNGMDEWLTQAMQPGGAGVGSASTAPTSSSASSAAFDAGSEMTADTAPLSTFASANPLQSHTA